MRFPPDHASETMAVAATRVLAVHAGYACRNSGACCEAHWPIPVEADQVGPLQRALDAQSLVPASLEAPALWFPPDAPPQTPARLGLAGGRCVFRDTEFRRCRVQNVLGHNALPLSCRQFPRVTVLDPRGVSVTLSHYCPTAAALLDCDTASGVIVTNALAFHPDGEYVGLDARDAFPPLLAPSMMMDWDAWWTWEALTMRSFEDMGASTDDVLARIGSAVEEVREWRPGGSSLTMTIRGIFAAPRLSAPLPPAPPPERLLEEVIETVPGDLRPSLAAHHRTPERVRRHFLAAHAFANWTAHLGRGLRSWMRSLQAADALLTLGLGVRQADLLLRHLTDPYVLADRWSRTEVER